MANEMLPGDVLGIFGSTLTAGVFTAELLNNGDFTVRDGLGNFPYRTGPDGRIKFLHMKIDGVLVMMDIGLREIRKATDASGATVHASRLVLHDNGDLVLEAITGSTALTWINGAFT
jgi:hypothetical protein